MSTKVTNTCSHCGDNCSTVDIKIEGKLFCCEGCKIVYELLNEADLCDYYTLNNQPGIKSETEVLKEKFAFLNAPEVQEKLIEFTDGTISRIKFSIPIIHCSSCIWLLENLQRLNTGVAYSMVNFPRKEVTVSFKSNEISLHELVVLLTSVGYEPLINLAESKDHKIKNQNTLLTLKIGVAGFAFGNIMFMSFPEYFDGDGMGLGEYRKLFGYLNLLLILPVILYSGIDYLKSAYSGIKNKYLNIDVPIAIGITVLFSRSAFEILTEAGAGYLDSLAGLIFFLLIGKWYQGKTYRALSFDRDYKSYFPLAVTTIKNAVESTLLAENLKPADTILVRNNELIPTDAILSKGTARIDYSFVTGEADAITKKVGDKVYAGGRQTGGPIELTVIKKLSKSYLTELWDQKIFQKEENHTYHNLLDRFSVYFTAAVIGIALITGIYWYFTDVTLVFESVTAVLIVACPCALALSLPFALGNTMRVLSNKGIFVKNVNAIEKLDKINAIVFDKTGTITHSGDSLVYFKGKSLTDAEKSYIKSIAKGSIHPLSKSVYNHLKETVIEVFDFKEVEGKGVEGIVNNYFIKLGSTQYVDTSTESEIKKLASTVHVCIDGNYLGYFEIKKKYRKGLKNLINKLQYNYSLHLLTGDGNQEQPYLEKLFAADSKLHFKQTPDDKLNYLEALKSNGNSPIMIGDGLNDAGALKAATVGISISDDVYSFSPSCDIIMEANKFDQVGSIIEFAKKSVSIVKVSLVISILYNIVGLSFAVTGQLSPLYAALLMPLSSVTVVGFVTLATNLAGRKVF